MEVREIDNDNFFEYREGFIDGGMEILNSIIYGYFSRVEIYEYDWYSVGYKDGYNYFLDYYENNDLVFLDLEINYILYKVIRDKFFESVSNYNNKYKLNVPALKLKIKLRGNYE